MKKVFIASSILLVFTLIFLSVYNFAFKKTEPDVSDQEKIQEKTKIAEKTTAEEKVVTLSNEVMISPALDSKNNLIMYFKKDGTIWRMDLDGKGKQQIAATEQTDIDNVLWSPNKNKVLIMIKKENQTSFFEYDIQTKKGVQLKNGLDAAVWDNMGTKIFYKYYDSKTQERSLNISNSDGSGWQKLANVEFKNISIASIPLTSTVSYWNYPNANEETKLVTVGFSGGEPQVLMKEKYGADYLWSPNGKQALVSALPDKDNKMTTLGLINLKGEFNNLGVPTFVSKCVWSADSKTVYYALPGDIPDSAVMPNDYQDKKFFSDDTFWKIDTVTDKKERIIETSKISGKHDSANLFVSPGENALYFINRVDGKARMSKRRTTTVFLKQSRDFILREKP